MPYINERVREIKYSTVQVVSRTLSMLDIQGIVIADEADRAFEVLWPVGFGSFPFQQKPKNCDFIYIRDLIEAMTSYIYYDYDETIRKIITSLDNALKHYQIKDKIRQKYPDDQKKLKFKNMMDEVVTRPELNFNIKKIYDIRNGIVHDKIRLNSKHETLLKKSIGTLLYIYKIYLNDSSELSRYILQIEMQFGSIINSLRGMKLEFFIQDIPQETKLIKTPQELDEQQFGSIKIQDNDMLNV